MEFGVVGSRGSRVPPVHSAVTVLVCISEKDIVIILHLQAPVKTVRVSHNSKLILVGIRHVVPDDHFCGFQYKKNTIDLLTLLFINPYCGLQIIRRNKASIRQGDNNFIEGTSIIVLLFK